MRLVAPCLSAAALSKVTGRVDRLGRPVVRIEIPGGESFLALIDTGFNGELMVAKVDAQMLGLTITTKVADVTVAGDLVQSVLEGIGSIRWLDVTRRVEIHISTAVPHRTMDDDPIAMIGTRLLSPHLLLIDFVQGTVEIETQT